MLAIKLNTETLRYIAALEENTGAEVKDCVVNEDSIIYVVKKGQLGMAIGKKGVNVNKIRSALGKNVQIVEYSEDPVEFINKMFSTLTLKNVSLDKEKEKKSMIIEADFKTRGTILGKKGKKVKILKDLLKRHYNIEEVLVK